jgi:Carboxypeptidase regulatory-like domain/Bacterial Ig-like domain (group 2)
MRLSVQASAAVLIAGLSAACGSSSSSPASASMVAPTGVSVASLKIIGAVNSRIVVGDTAQFTAMATMSNGSATNVTNDAVWSTSDASIFTVSAGGKVTAIAVGSADIRAAYQGVTDKDYTTAQPFLTFTAYGTVTAAPPDFGGLAGARVDITPSPTAGMFTTTSGSGDYSFPPLKGGIYTITVSRDGFHPETKTITATRDIRTDFPLTPIPPPGATARCKDRSWSYSLDRASACAANSGVSYWACPGPFCQA